MPRQKRSRARGPCHGHYPSLSLRENADPTKRVWAPHAATLPSNPAPGVHDTNPTINLLCSFKPADTVALLQQVNEGIFPSRNPIEIIIRQLAPVCLGRPLHLVPPSF